MRIVAALSWFDEPPGLLEQCVRSLAGVADSLVALDGRWNGFPGETSLSPAEQMIAIGRAACDAGVPALLHEGGPYPSQPVKRTELLRLAVAAGADWILVIDADEHIEQHDRQLLGQILASTGCDVAELQLRNEGPGVRNIRPRRKRRLLRAAADPAVGPAHNYLRSGDGRWLAGDPRHVDLDPAADASAALSIVNHIGARPHVREHAAEVYYTTRREPLPA